MDRRESSAVICWLSGGADINKKERRTSIACRQDRSPFPLTTETYMCGEMTERLIVSDL